MSTLHLSEFRMTPAGFVASTVTVQDGDRTLHRWNIYIPPLDAAYTEEECRRRATAYVEQGVETALQMFMSTTKGLTGAMDH